MSSRSSRRKEKYGNNSELSRDNCKEETAARTRPFNFDEIMLRRKNKKQSGDLQEGSGGQEHVSRRDIVERVSDHLESDRFKYNYSVASVVQHDFGDLLKSSRRKEDKISTKEAKLEKGKDKDIFESETKSKAMLNKHTSHKVKGGKIDGEVNEMRKNEEGYDSGNEYEKRQSRDFVGMERYADRSRGKFEKETKRKQWNEDDERTRDRSTSKKQDSGKWHNSEFSERNRRKESSHVHHEESRSKRGRSRSRERDKERSKRSDSLSPRAHKHTSYDPREQGGSAPHSSKDRLGRQHSDVEKKRTSSNGSSSHYRRNGGSASGLGGYSPRKRRSEAAVKTPPPTNRSPEKRSAGCDLPVTGTESNVTASILVHLQSSNQTVLSSTHEKSSVVSVASITEPVLGGFSNTSTSKANVSIDSIQLTEATRPMRRLYVENLPASASEKAVMGCLNNFLLSSGVNHIQGTQPCISCIIHKEKGQALVEFLTPEDASAALSFDGRSFSGSNFKIRRPKDFVEVSTGVPEKSVAAVKSISNIVKDSPHKIFIGGISEVISSEMLIEIAGSFGPLRAYHFEFNADLNKSLAFLEYVDQTVTLKACAGLNGLKLGGQVLTVVQAIPDASSVENTGNSPFYGIPEHAKPLLEKPTQVLKLKNVLHLEGLSSLSEPELEEILEDIRLECARFGTVKSVNVVKGRNFSATVETCEVIESTGYATDRQDLECDDNDKRIDTVEGMEQDPEKVCGSERSSSAKESDALNKAVEDDSSFDAKIGRSEPSSSREPEVLKAAEGNTICDDKLRDNLIREMCIPAPADGDCTSAGTICQENSSAISLELPNQLNNSIDQLEGHADKIVDATESREVDMENKPSVREELKSEEKSGKLEEASSELDLKGETKEKVSGLEDALEPGSVLVEYRRIEASSMAAHCLHGRVFDGRIVAVEYVTLDLYRARFPK